MSYDASPPAQTLRRLLVSQPQIKELLSSLLSSYMARALEATSKVDAEIELRRFQGEARAYKKLLTELSADAKAAP